MDIRSIGNMVQSGSGIAEKNISAAGSATAVKPAAAPAVAVAVEAVQQPEPVENIAQLMQAVKNINMALQEQSQNLEFSIDSNTGRTVVTVVDRQTQTVIRQMPSKEALEIAQALDNLQSLLLRQKA